MTLSRPPTMRVTFGVLPEASSDDEPPEPQAVRPAASAATAAAAVRTRTDFMGGFSFGAVRGGTARHGEGHGPARDGWGGAAAGSGAGAGGGGVRPPGEQPALDPGEDQLGEQRENR